MQIEVRNISKRYDKICALDNISFILPSQSVIGLVGPNGSGKSTLFKMMICRETPDCGDVLYDGTSLLEKPLETLPLVGLMPDDLPATKQWTVEPYLDFFARANRLSGEKRQLALDYVINLMKLDTFLDRKLNALSKGMKQRVSLARLLLSNPKVLLLDEPAAGLDPTARIELRECIRTLCDQGITIFISSHILSDLEDICDSLVILEQGKLRWAGRICDWHNNNTVTQTRIELDFLNSPDALMDAIHTMPHCAVVKKCGRKSLEIIIDGNLAASDEFLAALFQAHTPVTGMRILNNSIEEVFLKNTDGKLQ